MHRYYVYSDELLGVKCNVKDFTWIYGKQSPESTESSYSRCLIKVKLTVTNDKDTYGAECLKNCDSQFQHYYFDKKKNLLFYYRPMPLKRTLCYCIKISDDTVELIVGKTYYKYVKFRFMNLHSIGYILSDIVSCLLVKKGYLSLYCSAIYDKENTALFFGAPKTGKTLTCMSLCDKIKATYISEDVAITNGEDVFSVPWTNSYRSEKTNKIDSRESRPDYIAESLNEEGRKLSYKISHLILLDKSSDNTISDNAQIVKRINLLNRYLFPICNTPICSIISYFSTALMNKEEIESCEKDIWNRLTRNTMVDRFSQTEAPMFAIEYIEKYKGSFYGRE